MVHDIINHYIDISISYVSYQTNSSMVFFIIFFIDRSLVLLLSFPHLLQHSLHFFPLLLSSKVCSQLEKKKPNNNIISFYIVHIPKFILLRAKWSIFLIVHDLFFNEIMKSVLYTRVRFVVLVHWNCSPNTDFAHLRHILLVPRRPIFAFSF